ncbi:venom serine protease Bi-VSP [Drosophila novamexicana]|uniref:venom serine protease Bi-VSP n=1 Tax=Drosophila novamexicana TaxID=47314 RepID=UPI0011E5F0F3|nr:venom serine protease Bi-VSP [Drosophila novamexicana]
MKLVLSVVLTLGCLATPTPAQFNQRQVRENCVTPENYYGRCVALSYCPQAVNVFKLTDRRTAQNYVIALQRSCGTRSVNGDPLVCCTRPITNPVTERPPNPFFPSTEDSFVTVQVQPLPVTTRAPGGNPFLDPVTQAPATRPTARVTTSAPITSNPILQPRGPSCRFPPGKIGECVEIKSCAPVLSELQLKRKDPDFAKQLQASNLVCGRVGTQVCCPTGQTVTTPPPVGLVNLDEVPRRLPTVAEGCGATPKAAAFKKVVGGEPAKQGTWPWIALLGYDDGSSSPFKCGGTLITARHVITAAHCIRQDLTFVRLGEHDLTTDTEARHVDVPIAKYVSNPQYNSRIGRGDMAILYLERNVEFTDTIIPICMPSSPSLRAKSYVSSNPFVVGWGKTQEGGESSNILMQLMIPVLDNQVCRTSYAKVNRFFTEEQFDKAVLCAGVLTGGKDTCQGDSGGPLMTSEVSEGQMRFYLIGVVAYGVGCARPEVPGVYTSTQYFMDWILEQLLDTP